MSDIIWCGSNADFYSVGELGGKGHNLLKLYSYAQQSGLFTVPKFLILPVGIERETHADQQGIRSIFSDAVHADIEKLKKPIAVRSSSPLEDSVRASFAGIYLSQLGMQSLTEVGEAAYRIYCSAGLDGAEEYAQNMDIPFSQEMAIIVQEQVSPFIRHGIIQLEEGMAHVESTYINGQTETEDWDAETLAIYYEPGKQFKPYQPYQGKKKKYFGEIEYAYPVKCAQLAKETLRLSGTVQVEFLQRYSELPFLVQIRQLPEIDQSVQALDLSIPSGVPYLKSELCNGVAGDMTLPALPVLSQAQFPAFLIKTGQNAFLHSGDWADPRMAEFEEKSRFAQDEFFRSMRQNIQFLRGYSIEMYNRAFTDMWKRQNELHDEYILVCDKLDETCVDMDRALKNKKAIITCNEPKKTGHAMTRARELGIPCMGVNQRFDDLESFFHQVGEGDVIKFKSDGKHAVAYVVERAKRLD